MGAGLVTLALPGGGTPRLERLLGEPGPVPSPRSWPEAAWATRFLVRLRPLAGWHGQGVAQDVGDRHFVASASALAPVDEASDDVLPGVALDALALLLGAGKDLLGRVGPPRGGGVELEDGFGPEEFSVASQLFDEDVAARDRPEPTISGLVTEVHASPLTVAAKTQRRGILTLARP